MTYRITKFPWPFVKDDRKKVIYFYVVSGWPAVMAAPKKLEECFPGYKGHLCTHEEFQRIQNEQEKSC